VVEADRGAREHYAGRLAELLGRDTILVLPVLPRRGPMRAWSDEELFAYRGECFQLTAPSSLSGAPQVVVRITTGDEVRSGSVVGPRGSDLALLDLAAALSYQDLGVRV
jgi:Asp-tRNA(Asn)/Glu-tRNA(Gln) amidotransferase A subunit family amidase